MNYQFHKKRSSILSNLSASTIKRNTLLNSANPFYFDDVKLPNVAFNALTDRRFDNLINLVRPCYQLDEIKDIDKIISNNEAFKPSPNENPNFNQNNRNKMSLKVKIKT
jgi:hypothetical protein